MLETVIAHHVFVYCLSGLDEKVACGKIISDMTIIREQIPASNWPFSDRRHFPGGCVANHYTMERSIAIPP